MKISIYFDFVCPFCYVGLHSLSRAIEDLDVELDFHPYELQRFPTPKVDPMHDEKRLKRFYEVLKPMAQALGSEMNLPWISPHPYTTDAFQGYYFARQAGRDLDYVRLTFDVFYRRQKDIGDPAVLRMIMDKLGLDGAAFAQALTNGTFRAEVDQDWEAKSALNLEGIPAYQMNGEKIRGYHTPEEWRAILLDQAEKTMAGLVCTPEGCGPASQPLD